LTVDKLVDIIRSEGFCQEVDLPLYEYVCAQCGQHVEKIQKFSDSPLTRCEKCGGHLKRVLSAPAIQFKGSGWYVTDYARKSSTVAPNRPAGTGNGDKGKGAEAEKKEALPATKEKPDSGVGSQKPGVTGQKSEGRSKK
jgi:putative FmdB family regulatory protein